MVVAILVAYDSIKLNSKLLWWWPGGMIELREVHLIKNGAV